MKILRRKMLRIFQTLNSCKLFSYVGIKSVVTKKCPNKILTSLEPLITHIKVERLNIEIPSLIIIEQSRSPTFAIDIQMQLIPWGIYQHKYVA